MDNIFKLASGINIMPLVLELKRHSTLWGSRDSRTAYAGSPHRDIKDIWVRFGAEHTSVRPHDSVWYPESALLPSAKNLALQVMSHVRGERLGGVLITKVPAGKRVHRHTDHGWHSEYYDKFALQIESHQQQAFCFDEGELIAAPGDLYWFNNQLDHWVRNDSPVDRITMIICVRLDHGVGLLEEK